MIEDIISLLIEGNMIRKLIGKRKKLNKVMRERFDGLRYQATQGDSYQQPINILVFKNNVVYFKSCYYEVSEFEQIINEQYGGLDDISTYN